MEPDAADAVCAGPVKMVSAHKSVSAAAIIARANFLVFFIFYISQKIRGGKIFAARSFHFLKLNFDVLSFFVAVKLEVNCFFKMHHLRDYRLGEDFS